MSRPRKCARDANVRGTAPSSANRTRGLSINSCARRPSPCRASGSRLRNGACGRGRHCSRPESKRSTLYQRRSRSRSRANLLALSANCTPRWLPSALRKAGVCLSRPCTSIWATQRSRFQRFVHHLCKQLDELHFLKWLG
jgi:hypothetical protein